MDNYNTFHPTAAGNQYCGDNKRTVVNTNFICLFDNLWSQYRPDIYEYEVDIMVSAACPSQRNTVKSKTNAVSGNINVLS